MGSRSWGTWEINASFGRRIGSTIYAAILSIGLVACSASDPRRPDDSPYAPGVDTRKAIGNSAEVGHRLVQAGQYELALDAFNRAALQDGLTAEILLGMGSANLGLGRLGQAEKLMLRAIDQDEHWPEAWNNLGVVLMEQGKTAEAQQIFQKAYAIDNGKSDAIRDNLRLALAKSDNSGISNADNQDYKLVRRGSGDFLIRNTP
ncbi:MAG: tetratricopeptide repeat protein [Paracoccaceae bacterium]